MIEEKNRIRGAVVPVLFILGFILLSACLSGCGSAAGGASGGGTASTGADIEKNVHEAAGEPDIPGARLQVVTTIFPQYDFARHIAGDAADVYMLLKPGEEVHSYEPTPQDIRLIQGSDLFIYTGGENDVWLDSILESIAADAAAAAGQQENSSVLVNRPRPHTVRFLDLVDTYEEEHLEGMMPEKGGHDHAHAEEDEDSEEKDGDEADHEAAAEEYGRHEEPDGHGAGHEAAAEEHSHGEPDGDEAHDHHHEEPDEHVWTSPANCAVLIEKITEEFCALDPGNAAQYRANGEAYRAEFEALDAEYREMILAAKRKTIIFGDRFPFRYLAEAYGLTCYAAFSGCSAESEPSAATIAFLIEKAVEEEVPVVFTIEFSNGNIARAVSEAAQVRLEKKRKAPEAAEAASADSGEAGEKRPVQIHVLRLHSCHNLTRDEFASGETCLSLMRQNLEALRAALN